MNEKSVLKSLTVWVCLGLVAYALFWPGLENGDRITLVGIAFTYLGLRIKTNTGIKTPWSKKQDFSNRFR